ncbi:ABCA1, partial [Symbiodinium sp. CCMP2456]
ELIALAFPLVFIVAFLYTQKKVLNELISEKETKVRESLRMLGVGSPAIISSWYLTYGIIFGILCAIFALTASFYVFPGSSGTLIFAFFWLWCMSFLAFAWFIHCFFNQSRTGGIVGMIIMFAQWIVYSSQNRDGPPSETVTLLLMFMPNAAFCTGLAVLAKFEAARVGAQWGNAFMQVANSSFASVLGMMCLDILLYTLLGWYLDRVVPKEFGVRLPFYFPFQRSFWQSLWSPAALADAAATAEEAALNGPAALCVGSGAAEPVPEALRRKSAASGCNSDAATVCAVCNLLLGLVFVWSP